MDLLDRLLEHDRWATAQLLDLSRDKTDDHLDRPFDISHGTLRATFDHMIFNVAAWTAIMAGRSADGIPRGGDLAALSDRHERTHADFAAFARQKRDEGRLDDTFADEVGERATFGGTILHVVLHNAEHRTEAQHILVRLGLPEVPELDLALWDLTVRGKEASVS